MKSSKFTSIVVIAALLSACTQSNGAPNTGVENGGGINKTDVGTVGGAVGGAVLGSLFGHGAGKVAATIGGGLLGGFVGNSIGKSLDNADKAAYNQASQSAMENSPNGQSMPWKNSQSGNSGSITPTNTYQNSGGQYCREYTQTINVGGQSQQAHGNACREPDGTWQVSNSN